MVSFSAAEALGDGIERLQDRRLLPVVLAVFLAQLASVVGAQSQLAAQRSRLDEESQPFGALVPEELPLALDLPLGVAFVLWLAASLLLVAVTIVAMRVVATDDESAPEATGAPSADVPSADAASADAAWNETGSAVAASNDAESNDALSTDAPSTVDRTDRPSATDGLLLATGHALAGAVLFSLAVGAGLVLFVLPGLFLAAALALTLPAVALDRAGVLEAMARSWELTEGRRLPVFAFLVGLLATLLAADLVGSIAGALLAGVPLIGDVVNVALAAIGWLVAVAALVSAFERLEELEADDAEKWAGVDDELLP